MNDDKSDIKDGEVNDNIRMNDSVFEYIRKGKNLEIVTQVFLIIFILLCGYFIAYSIKFQEKISVIILGITFCFVLFSIYKGWKQFKLYRKLQIAKIDSLTYYYNNRHEIKIDKSKLIWVNYFDTLGSGSLSVQLYILYECKYFLLDFGLRKNAALELLNKVKEFTGIYNVEEVDKTFFSTKIKFVKLYG